MVPLIRHFIAHFSEAAGSMGGSAVHIQGIESLWWALALGACLGGATERSVVLQRTSLWHALAIEIIIMFFYPFSKIWLLFYDSVDDYLYHLFKFALFLKKELNKNIKRSLFGIMFRNKKIPMRFAHGINLLNKLMFVFIP